MLDARLSRRLEEVAVRLRRVRRQRGFTVGWLVAAAAMATLLTAGLVGSSWPLLLLPLAVLAGALWRARSRSGDALQAARLVEQRYPDLDAELFTAAGLEPHVETGRYGYLQDQVVSDVLRHARSNDWRFAVSPARLWLWRLGHVAALALFVTTVVFTWRTGSDTARLDGAEELAAATTAHGEDYLITVEPGDVELERGSSLLVLARFDGKLPADVELVAVNDAGEQHRLALAKSLDDPLFGGRLPEVTQDLTYHVAFDGRESDAYRVTTFEYPELLQADATVVHPEYTGLGEKTIEDVRRLSVVEGSTVTLTCRLNKPVASAELRGPRDSPALHEAGDDGRTMAVMLQPGESQRLTLVLSDDAGRENKEPPEFVIEVIPNEPPELAVEFPARDVRVSPLEEMSLVGTAQDDFGLAEYGLVYQSPTGEERTLVLGESALREETVELAHLLSLEEMQVSPQQLVSYYFYAEDVGPDGESRRTFSDMFFAEVRHFDEEYRQMPFQQGQGQGQGGGQCQKLIELQRQVVSGTWNTIREYPQLPTDDGTETFVEDAGTLEESQAAVLELTRAFEAQLTDLMSKQYAAEAIEYMDAARGELGEARSGPSVAPLPDARLAAQDAYQALLRLQAREHFVKQSQASAAGQPQASRRMDRQLDQLELDNDRNRYEQESQPQQQREADRELLQVLNRLRELARRQEDLNDRIRELENKLRDAEGEEREELERQLKRLQEEQEELLRDLEEVQERMNRPETRRQMADARRELEQTRENVRRASEALEQGRTSRALTSATRAQRELEELRDEFRRQTAGEFADVLEQLREDARELVEREQELAEELTESGRPRDDEQERRSLRDPVENDLDALADGFDGQRQALNDILQRMREIVEQAESSEPLLAEQLYETVRESRVDRPEEALETASQWLRRGFPQQVPPLEEQARRGMERIRDGIEEAAQSVLGDELEGLRRARSELAELTEAIANELAQADPEFARQRQQPQQPGSENESDGSAAAENRASDQPTDPQQDSAQPPQRGSRPGEQPGQTASDQRSESQQPGESPGQQPSQSESQSPSQGESQTPSQSPGQSPGQQPSPGQTPGQTPGRSESSQSGSASPGQRDGRTGSSDAQPSRRQTDLTSNPYFQTGGQDGGGHFGPHMPLTGSDFVEWSDQMRDIEEMLSDPELRGEAAAIRQQARAERIEVRRHSKQPNWELVRTQIYGRMLELQDRLAEEIARRSGDDELVPIDRDPVPAEYADLVREYYERLGRGRTSAE